MISSSRDSLNWSGVSSKTASVDLEKRGAAWYSWFISKNIKFSNFVFRSHPMIFFYSLEVTELLLKFLFIRLCIPLDQVLIKDRRALELRASWERVCQISTCSWGRLLGSWLLCRPDILSALIPLSGLTSTCSYLEGSTYYIFLWKTKSKTSFSWS